MLGWFKKKFSRKGEEQRADQLVPGGDEPAVAEEVEVKAPAEEQEILAVEKVPGENEVEETAVLAAADGAAEPEENVEPLEKVGEDPGEIEDLKKNEDREDVSQQQERIAEPQEKDPEQPAQKSLFQRLQERLGKTRQGLLHRLDALFLGKKEIDAALLDDLEEVLITSDLGVATTTELLEAARAQVKRNELSDPQVLKGVLRETILTFLRRSDQDAELVMPESGPFVIMVVGVNGVGKTTTIGKVANKFKQSGQSVLLIAADTFRAAAIDQLKIWGERVGVEVVAREPGEDPSSVVYDGLAYGKEHNFDVIMIDTAGRLHTSVNLMEELKKIKRVIGKKCAGAPHEVLLVLDATTGQNGISQASIFHDAVGVSGLALTKLDGTAKGGIVANICRTLQIPVRFIGIGEQMDDLRDFNPEEFVDALFGENGEESAPGE